MKLIEMLQAFQVFGDLLAGAVADRHYWQSKVFTANALLLQHAFNTGGVAFGKQQVDTVQQFIMQPARFVEFAFQRVVYHAGEVFGKAVGSYRDHTFHTNSYLGQHQVIVTRKDREMVRFALYKLHALAHISAGFFNGYDVFEFFSQSQRCCG